jgi:hypothetical protein
MSDGPLTAGLVLAAAINLAVDRLTAEIVGLFVSEGIPTLLIKGPAIQEALYPDTVRPYGDSDLLVRARDWDRAVALLGREGFSDYLGPMAHPRMESLAGTAFLRGNDNLDLHATLEGLSAGPDAVWEAFSEHAQSREIGGRSVLVPGRPALLMHVALHVAKHPAVTKPAEDLRRAISQVSLADWRAAAEVAERLGGLAIFAEGLRLSPQGQMLAQRLGVQDVSSVQTALRTSGVPVAEGLNELLSSGIGLEGALARLRAELLPNASFMRWNHGIARRGRLGLALAYPQRWWFLATKLPGALREVWRVRRHHRSG